MFRPNSNSHSEYFTFLNGARIDPVEFLTFLDETSLNEVYEELKNSEFHDILEAFKGSGLEYRNFTTDAIHSSGISEEILEKLYAFPHCFSDEYKQKFGKLTK